MTTTLKISAFRDISSFLLTILQNESGLNLDIKYVQNADEAHQDLKENRADLVFMSYDDTLSVSLEDKYPEIIAIQPIHGGILDLCGEIDITNGKTKIGIDTDSGYARVLRAYLQSIYSASDYQKLEFIKAGATNIRAEKLQNGELDATLLNPPFSYLPGINRDQDFRQFIGHYQGVGINTNKLAWLDVTQRSLIQEFLNSYRNLIHQLQSNQPEAINRLMSFYQISQETAINIYERLWQLNGLSSTLTFDAVALSETEKFFTKDTQIQIPDRRYWLLDPTINGVYLDPNAISFFELSQNPNLGSLIYDFSTIDSEISSQVEDSALQKTDAAFDNLIGLYPILNENGAILDILDINNNGRVDDILNPSDFGYARTAIASRVDHFGLRLGANGHPEQNTTASEFGNVVLSGNHLYAPFVIANGGNLVGINQDLNTGIEEFLQKNPMNIGATSLNFKTHEVAYFSFSAANPDQSQHLKNFGSNTFGFEDLPNISGITDNDFNDAVFQFFFIVRVN